jgi:uncharacterized protein (DUF302 family)
MNKFNLGLRCLFITILCAPLMTQGNEIQVSDSIINVTHVQYLSSVGFDGFTSRFESLLGKHDVTAYQNLLKDPKKIQEVENIIEGQAGQSGFMIFAVLDHGSLLEIKGVQQKAKQYVIGNPLFAARMTEHEIRSALYAPLRVLVYEDSEHKTLIEYDLPSRLFGQFNNPEVDLVAKDLDLKLETLIKDSMKSN